MGVVSRAQGRAAKAARPLLVLKEEREVCRKHAADDGNADHPGKDLVDPVAVFPK
jgi:hypothetical protein